MSYFGFIELVFNFNIKIYLYIYMNNKNLNEDDFHLLQYDDFDRYVSLEEQTRLLEEDKLLIESFKNFYVAFVKNTVVLGKKSLLTTSFLLSGPLSSFASVKTLKSMNNSSSSISSNINNNETKEETGIINNSKHHTERRRLIKRLPKREIIHDGYKSYPSQRGVLVEKYDSIEEKRMLDFGSYYGEMLNTLVRSNSTPVAVEKKKLSIQNFELKKNLNISINNKMESIKPKIKIINNLNSLKSSSLNIVIKNLANFDNLSLIQKKEMSIGIFVIVIMDAIAKVNHKKTRRTLVKSLKNTIFDNNIELDNLILRGGKTNDDNNNNNNLFNILSYLTNSLLDSLPVIGQAKWLITKTIKPIIGSLNISEAINNSNSNSKLSALKGFVKLINSNKWLSLIVGVGGFRIFPKKKNGTLDFKKAVSTTLKDIPYINTLPVVKDTSENLSITDSLKSLMYNSTLFLYNYKLHIGVVIFLLIFRNVIYKLITDKEYRKTFDITESFVSFTQGNETADAEKTIVACNNFNTFRWAGGGF